MYVTELQTEMYLDRSGHVRPSVSKNKKSDNGQRHEDGFDEARVVNEHIDVF